MFVDFFNVFWRRRRHLHVDASYFSMTMQGIRLQQRVDVFSPTSYTRVDVRRFVCLLYSLLYTVHLISPAFAAVRNRPLLFLLYYVWIYVIIHTGCLHERGGRIGQNVDKSSQGWGVDLFKFLFCLCQNTSEEVVSKVTAAACQLLSSAKDALHDDDISRLQIPSLEKFGNRMPLDVEPEPDVSTEPVLKPEDTTSDVVKLNDDRNEETSLEDIEAKVNQVL